MNRQAMTVDDVIATVGQIDSSYRHHERQVLAGPPLILDGVVIKWYQVFRESRPVPVATENDARDWVRDVINGGKIPIPHGFGFAVLHHSEALDYLFLSTFYQTQELWQRVWVRDVGSNEPFRSVQPGVDWSSLCVWELAPIWAERNAWNRYLYSARDERARRAYIDDVFTGSTGES